MTATTQVQFVQFCIQYSSIALIYYDYALTFKREVKYVWNRPFHILTVMFFFCRFSLLSNPIFLHGLKNKLGCDTAYTIAACLGVLGRIGILAILGVRTCALYQYNRFIVGLFGLLGTLVAVAAILHVPNVSCTGTKVLNNPGVRVSTDLLSTSTVVFELLSTAFVVASCLRNMKSIGSLKLQKNSLLYLMLKEGLLYTGFVTAFTTTALILNYGAPLGSFFQRLLNALTMPISGIMTARFLLHVREWQGDSNGDRLGNDLNIESDDFDFPDHMVLNMDRSLPSVNVAFTRSVSTIESFGADTEIYSHGQADSNQGVRSDLASAGHEPPPLAGMTERKGTTGVMAMVSSWKHGRNHASTSSLA